MLAFSFSGYENETSPGKGLHPSDDFIPTNPAQSLETGRRLANQQILHHSVSFRAGIAAAQKDVLSRRRANEDSAECYTPRIMYARKLQAELVIGEDRRPAPLDWLDSFCMRNFTGSSEFDDTLPTAEGRLEAGLAVDPQRLAQAMSEWFTKRGKGNGQPVTIELKELDAAK